MCVCVCVYTPVLSAGGVTDDDEAASPVPNVMDNSGALSSGGPDPGSRGVVKMPDSESLRRSMAAEQQRQAAMAKGSLPGPGVETAPVSATSSGGFAVFGLVLTSRGTRLEQVLYKGDA